MRTPPELPGGALPPLPPRDGQLDIVLARARRLRYRRASVAAATVSAVAAAAIVLTLLPGAPGNRSSLAPAGGGDPNGNAGVVASASPTATPTHDPLSRPEPAGSAIRVAAGAPGRIQGTVLDKSGRPAAGVALTQQGAHGLHVAGHSGGSIGGYTTTGNGSFDLPCEFASGQLLVSGAGTDLGGQVITTFSCGTRLSVSLPEAGGITGDGGCGGQFLPDSSVSLLPLPESPLNDFGFSYEVPTSAQGQFAFSGLSAGTYLVQESSPIVEEQQVTVTPGTDVSVTLLPNNCASGEPTEQPTSSVTDTPTESETAPASGQPSALPPPADASPAVGPAPAATPAPTPTS